ncbi:MAG TPA: FecR family protein [Thermoanaerobaculia bacterium]|jgi:ferric-dicitrate binding protein FerR (iron transport regulator)
MTDQILIERLLRLADPGPELPAGGEQRIRAAVHPLWLREVRARRARRHRAIAGSALAAVAAAVVIVILLPAGSELPPAPLPVARVELVRGVVGAAFQQNPIVAGTRLETADGRAALRLRAGESLRLDGNTTVRLISAHVVELERGAIYVDSGGRRGMPVEVRTRFGIVRDIGTRFEVRAADTLRVAVREGSVGVSTSRVHFHVAAGFAATLSGASHEMHSIAGGDSGWTATIAPPFAIEGRTVAELFDWCSRESGVPVRYIDRATETVANTTRLHGTPIDAAPLDVAGMIAPTAGLTAAPRDGALVVARAGATALR